MDEQNDIVEKLTEELGEPLGRLFASAERLHANFYHGFLSRTNFEVHREDCLKLVEKLRNYVSRLLARS